MGTEHKPLLLVIATGPQLYREYLLRSISTRYRVHLITADEPTWELPYLAGATVSADTGAEAVLTAARQVADAEPVHGVMSWHEEHIVQAALVAEDLGLPGSSPAAVRRCRDKFATRTALAEHGLPQPAFALVAGVKEALAAAEQLGYPVVLKPRGAGGSEGVVLAEDAESLTERFRFAHDVTVPHGPVYEQACLVEEFLDAPEISVDSVIHGGTVTGLFVGRKEIGFAPYFEEIGHHVSNCDPLLTDPGFLRILTAVHEALGYTDGWTHAEFKLTEQGPKLIEVNGRLGGDLIPYLGMRASGIDPGLAAAAVACGEKPVTTASDALVAGVRFFYPEHDGTLIDSVDFDRSAAPAETDLLVPLVGHGAVVSPPPKGIVEGRMAFATVVAASPETCTAALDAAQAALRVRTGDTKEITDCHRTH